MKAELHCTFSRFNRIGCYVHERVLVIVQLITKVNLSMRKAFDKKMPGSKCLEAVYQNVVTIIVRTHYLLRFLISTFCVYT